MFKSDISFEGTHTGYAKMGKMLLAAKFELARSAGSPFYEGPQEGAPIGVQCGNCSRPFA
jgi:uncharacterized OB-fold protein